MATAGKILLGVACLGAVATASRASQAQSTSAAQELFDEGRRLLKQGDVAAACAKLAESQRIEPAGGTLLNLAACHAREGRTATAWAEFHDALAQATRDGRDDRIDEAKRQIAELEPHLTRLTIVVESRGMPGLDVRVDGTTLGPASWGAPMPVDPGEHEVRASAPAHSPWTSHVSLAAAARGEVTVPALTPIPAAAAPPMHEVRVAPVRPSPVPAYALFGAGVAGVGVGVAFGLVAIEKKHASQQDCTSAGCTTEGASLLRQANTAAWVSDVAFGVGVAAAAIGVVYLLASGPKGDSARSFARSGLAVRVGPLGVGGSW